MRKMLAKLLAILGAVILFAGQTGPNQAFSNFGGWARAIGLGGIWRGGLASWASAVGTTLIATGFFFVWLRSGDPRVQPSDVPTEHGGSPSVKNNPLVSQIDSLINRLERANEVYASDPKGLFDLPKYAKYRMQVKEMDHVGHAVRLAIERKFGSQSKEQQLAEAAMTEEIKAYSPPDDDFFRAQIDWLMRVRSVATLLT
jgi:hypothetical protein